MTQCKPMHDATSARLIALLLVALALAGCASTASNFASKGVLLDDGSYYFPAQDGQGDYYYEETPSQTDSAFVFSFGYGPFGSFSNRHCGFHSWYCPPWPYWYGHRFGGWWDPRFGWAWYPGLHHRGYRHGWTFDGRRPPPRTQRTQNEDSPAVRQRREPRRAVDRPEPIRESPGRRQRQDRLSDQPPFPSEVPGEGIASFERSLRIGASRPERMAPDPVHADSQVAGPPDRPSWGLRTREVEAPPEAMQARPERRQSPLQPRTDRAGAAREAGNVGIRERGHDTGVE